VLLVGAMGFIYNACHRLEHSAERDDVGIHRRLRSPGRQVLSMIPADGDRRRKDCTYAPAMQDRFVRQQERLLVPGPFCLP
jgi:hypothetical protein